MTWATFFWQLPHLTYLLLLSCASASMFKINMFQITVMSSQWDVYVISTTLKCR
jgi:hypothetical protein